MAKRGQTAIEFVILFAAMLFFFVIFIAFLNSTIAEKNYQKKDIAVTELAKVLADEINLAYDANEGYYRQFKMPPTILGNDYQIQLGSNFVYIISNDSRHAASYPVRNVSGQPFVMGTNAIRKVNGSVVLN